MTTFAISTDIGSISSEDILEALGTNTAISEEEIPGTIHSQSFTGTGTLYTFNVVSEASSVSEGLKRVGVFLTNETDSAAAGGWSETKFNPAGDITFSFSFQVFLEKGKQYSFRQGLNSGINAFGEWSFSGVPHFNVGTT